MQSETKKTNEKNLIKEDLTHSSLLENSSENVLDIHDDSSDFDIGSNISENVGDH
jgi:hypothetical protein